MLGQMNGLYNSFCWRLPLCKRLVQITVTAICQSISVHNSGWGPTWFKPDAAQSAGNGMRPLLILWIIWLETQNCVWWVFLRISGNEISSQRRTTVRI